MSQRELAEILDDLRRGYDGDAWHGPPLRAVLDGVTAEIAAAHPVPGGHGIGAIVAHLAAWDGVVARRLAEGVAIESPEAGDFPPVAGTWEETLRELDRQHAGLLEVAGRLDAARLDEPVAGKDYAIAHMLRGVAQHMAYHAGQIALLRKLAQAGPRAGTGPGAS